SAAIDSIAPLCFGTTGTITASGLNGYGGYTYQWASGESTRGVTKGAGTWCVTVTDVRGCVAQSCRVIQQLDTMTAVIQGPALVCVGSTGTIRANVSGGKSPYSYLWSNGSTTQQITVGRGTYTVLVTDASGRSCQATASFTINEAAPVVANIAADSLYACGPTTVVTATATGGAGTSFIFNWSNGDAGPSTQVGAGKYYVTVTDSLGCQAMDSVAVTLPAGGLLDAKIDSIAPLCSGTTATLNASGLNGYGGYTYRWSSGETTRSVVKGVGQWCVTVTDIRGCQIEKCITVSENLPLNVTIDSGLVACFGQTTSITANPTGGQAPYTYRWSTGETTRTLSNIFPGTYTVVVTDNNPNACQAGITVTVTQASRLNTSMLTQSVRCFGESNGTAGVVVSGGIPPYQYFWNPGQFSGNTLNNLTAGTYRVDITDAGGCKTSDSVSVAQPAPISVTTLFTDSVSCSGLSDGSAEVFAAGGTPQFTFQWLPAGGNDNKAENLPAGPYQVRVTDSKGCLKIHSLVIGQPAPLVTNASTKNVTCYNNGDGSIRMNASGGTLPYFYAWSPNVSALDSANGLQAGTYAVTITDRNGCSIVTSRTLAEPQPIVLSTTTKPTYCDLPKGQARVIVLSGGAAPFTYSWVTSSGLQTGNTATGLEQGTYEVTVTDKNGCSAAASAVVGLGPTFTVTAVDIKPVSCANGSNGSARASVGGQGVGSFSYRWIKLPGMSVVGTESFVDGLTPGEYVVEVSDTNGCTVRSEPFELINPPVAQATALKTDVRCNGGCDGTATANMIGGVPPYQFKWSDASIQTTQTAFSLCPGIYQVTVTDSLGCSAQTSVSISEPPPMTLDSSVVNTDCNESNGEACVLISGGIGPYQTLWPQGQTEQCISALPAGTYVVSVTDFRGCNQVLPVTVANSNAPSPILKEISTPDCFGECDGYAIVGLDGDSTFISVEWDAAAGGQTSVAAYGLCAGIYTVKFTTAEGCVSTLAVTIDQPDELSVLLSKTDPTCFESCDGTAQAVVRGGVPPYRYSWINDQGTQISDGDRIENICAGSVRLLIFDANNCQTEKTIELIQPGPISLSVQETNALCNAECSGSAEVFPTGGVSPYSYVWDEATGDQSTRKATGLCAGNYTVRVVDRNGCEATAEAIVQQPDTFTIVKRQEGLPSCFGICDGFIEVRASGGIAPYNYAWANGIGSGTTALNLCDGNYSVSATDANGCLAVLPISIAEPNPLNTFITATSPGCADECTGTLLAQTTGGTQPYQIVWDAPGSPSTPFVDSLCPGGYTAYITDKNNCKVTKTAFISEPTLRTVSFTKVEPHCGKSDGQLCAQVSGGTAPYTYLWSDLNQQTGVCADSLRAGCYELIVTDASGCSSRHSICLDNESGPEVAVNGFKDLTCFGSDNGFIEFAFSGGTGLVRSAITNQQGDLIDSNTVFVDGLEQGCYRFTAVDAAQCQSSITQCLRAPQPLGAFILDKTTTKCFNTCDAQAQVKAIGGTAPYSYFWNAGSNPNDSLNTGLCAGLPQVTVRDANFCTLTVITQIESPDILSYDSSFAKSITCNGACNGRIEAFMSGGTLPYTYQWSNSLPNSPQVNGLCPGSYSLTVVDRNGCVANNQFQLNEPTPLLTSKDSVPANCGLCNGQASVSVIGGNQPYQYSWFGLGSTPDKPQNSGLCPGTYVVKISDANGCEVMESMSIIGIQKPRIDSIGIMNPTCSNSLNGALTAYASGGFGPLQFRWDANAFNQTTQTAVALKSGTYCVTVRDDVGCEVSRCASILNPFPVSMVIPNQITSCKGESALLYASAIGGTGNYTYYWSDPSLTGPGPFNRTHDQTTTYCVSATDTKGCRSNDTCITINVIPDPQLVMSPGNTFCEGDTVKLFARASGGKPTAYNWSWTMENGSALSAFNQFDYSEILLTPDTSGYYHVKVTDGCNRPALDSVFVTVNPLPDLTIDAGPRKYCAPGRVELRLSSGDLNSYAVDFQCDGIADYTGPDTLVEFIYRNPGTYSFCVEATTVKGCKASTSFTNYYTINPSPTAYFEVVNPVVDALDPKITLNDMSSGADVMTWNFGNEWMVNGPIDTVFNPLSSGVSGPIINPTYVFKNEGDHLIKLTVENRFGCKAEHSQLITVEPEFAMYVPNAFTPDDDGFNDTFQPKGIGFAPEDFKLIIFNRWGEEIWQSNNYNHTWDGKIDGRVVQNDVYIWMLTVIDFTGHKRHFKGHVTVFK
ncbi:MAG TPA: gliding motility-associated C-terminal domain-containing protein, partial [Luteibaculaceae bacterium]|nr:gliding motility-associated C-terminal domain-containing protein [Luteibaculaceae bacterium]